MIHDLEKNTSTLHLHEGTVAITPDATGVEKEYDAKRTITIKEDGRVMSQLLRDSTWSKMDKETEVSGDASNVTAPSSPDVVVKDAHAAFPDVSGNHLHIQGINYGKNNDIFGGYPDGTFKPDNPVNRAEFTKIVVNALFPNQDTGSNCFPDVKDEWFASFVCLAKEKNIIGGYPNGTFKPTNNIKFSEGAKVIVNTFGFDVDTNDPIWYKPFVEELGLRRAIPTTITDFGQLMTRGEMAEIVYRLSEKITDKPSQTYSGIESKKPHDPYKWYENKNLAFKTKYHETWQTAETEVSGLPIVYFASPASEEGDFREVVTVVVEDLSANPMTLEQYSDLALAQFKQMFPDYNQLSLDTIRLGNKNAKKVIYTYSAEGLVLKNMQIWTVLDNKAYVLSYNALESTYNVFEKHANDIINSFEFL